MSNTLITRFWEKVKRGQGCWEWTGSKDPCGYGHIFIKWSSGKPVSDGAHRVSWIIHNGKLPRGKHVLHKCDNPGCVRPDHLWIGTHQDNMADRQKKGRSRGAPGETNSHAKLTQEQVDEIRRLFVPNRNRPKNQPNTTRDLARRYGVTPSQIYHVYRGWSWKK